MADIKGNPSRSQTKTGAQQRTRIPVIGPGDVAWNIHTSSFGGNRWEPKVLTRPHKLLMDQVKKMDAFNKKHNIKANEAVLGISSHMTASTFGSMPQYAMDEYLRLTEGKKLKKVISFDMETFGSPAQKGKPIYGTNPFGITEITFKEFSINTKSNLSRGVAPKHISTYSALVKPTSDMRKGMAAIVKKLDDVIALGKGRVPMHLTDIEKRTAIDSIKFARGGHSSLFEELFGKAARGVTGATYSADMGLNFRVGRHGIFDIKGIEEKMQAMSPREFAKLLPAIKEGMNTMRDLGTPVTEVLQQVAARIKTGNSAGATFLSANGLNFDVPILQTLATQAGVAMPKIERHLDVFQLTKAIYPNVADLHRDVAADPTSISHVLNYSQESLRISIHGDGSKYSHVSHSDVDNPMDILFGKGAKKVRDRMDRIIGAGTSKTGTDPLKHLMSIVNEQGSLTAIPQYDPTKALQVGSRLYVHKGPYDPEDIFSVLLDKKVGKGGRVSYEKAAVDQVATKGIYEVEKLWKLDSQAMAEIYKDEDIKKLIAAGQHSQYDELYGVHLWDEASQRRAIITAPTRESLAAKMQGSAIDAGLLGEEGIKELRDSISMDKARRFYENMLEATPGKSSGLTLAKKMYGLAALAQQSNTTIGELFGDTFSKNPTIQERLRALEAHDLTTTQRRNAALLDDRLKSELPAMSEAIQAIESSADTKQQQHTTFAKFMARLPKHEEVYKDTGLEDIGFSTFNRYTGSDTWIDLRSADTASQSIFSLLKVDTLGRHGEYMGPEQEAAAKEARFRGIIYDLQGKGKLSAEQGTQILELPDSRQRIQGLVTMAAQTEAAIPPERRAGRRAAGVGFQREEMKIQSMSARSADWKNSIGDISSMVGAARSEVSATTMPKAKMSRADTSIFFREFMESKDSFSGLGSAHKDNIVEMMSSLYESYGTKGAGVGFGLQDSKLTMFLYNPKNSNAVNRAFSTGNYSAHVAAVNLPFYDEYGNVTIGSGTKLAQRSIRKVGGKYQAVDMLQSVERELGRLSRHVAEPLGEGQIDNVMRRASWAVGLATKPFSGVSRWVKDHDSIDASPVGRNLKDVVGSESVIFNEIIHDIYGDRDKEFMDLTDTQKLQLFKDEKFTKALTEAGISDISPAGTGPNAYLHGKVSTIDARSLHTFGGYNTGARENLVQDLNYFPVSREGAISVAKQELGSGGTRKVHLGPVSMTETRLALEGKTSAGHVSGVTAIGMQVSDMDLEGMKSRALQEIDDELKGATGQTYGDLVRERREIAGVRGKTHLTSPRTFEQAGVFSRDILEDMDAKVGKTIRVSDSSITDKSRAEMMSLVEKIDKTGPEDITPGKRKKVADIQRADGGTRGIYFGEAAEHASTLDSVRYDQGSGNWIMDFTYQRKAGIGTKITINGEKETVGSALSRKALTRLTGDSDISYLYWENQKKHQSHGAMLENYFNRAAYESMLGGRESEFTASVSKNFGVDIRKETLTRGLPKGIVQKFFVTPDAIKNVNGDGTRRDMLSAMEQVYKDIGLTFDSTKRIEAAELRMANVDEHYNFSTYEGAGKGAKMGGREIDALRRQMLTHNEKGELTSVGQWIKSSVEGHEDYGKYRAESIGKLTSLERLVNGSPAEVEHLTNVSSLKMLQSSTESLYHPSDLKGTIFDEGIFGLAEGDTITGKTGTYLSLGDTVHIPVGRRGETKAIDKIWVGYNHINYTEDGRVILGSSQKSLNDIVNLAGEYHSSYVLRDSMRNPADIRPDSTIRRELTEKISEYYAGTMGDITSSSGTVFEHGVGGRMASSGMKRVQIINPMVETELGTAYITRKGAEDIFGDKLMEKFMHPDTGKETDLLTQLQGEGVYGLGQRFPNIHPKTIQALKYKITDDKALANSRSRVFIDAATSRLFNADTDGDQMSIMLALNKWVNPYENDRSELYWSSQRELRAAVESVNAPVLPGNKKMLGGRLVGAEEIGDRANYSREKILEDIKREYVPGEKYGSVASPDYIHDLMQKEYDDPAFIPDWKDDVGKAKVRNKAGLLEELEITWAQLDREMANVSRISKGTIGKFSNVSGRMREAANTIWKTAQAQDGNAEHFTKIGAVEELGRLIEQNAISYKNIRSGEEHISNVEELYNIMTTPYDDMDETYKPKFLAALDSIGISDKGKRAEMMDSLGQPMTTGYMVDSAMELRNAAGASYGSRQHGIGYSSGLERTSILEAMDIISGRTSSYHGEMFKSHAEYLGSEGVQNALSAQAGFKYNPTRLTSSAEDAGTGSMMNMIEQMQHVGIRTEGAGTANTMGDLMGNLVKDLSKNPVAKGIGFGIGGLILATGLSMKGRRDSDVEAEPISGPAPQSTGGPQSVRLVENTPQAGMSLSVRESGSMSGQQVAGHVNGAAQRAMPYEVRTSVNVNDNTQNFDQGFLQSVFAKSL